MPWCSGLPHPRQESGTTLSEKMPTHFERIPPFSFAQRKRFSGGFSCDFRIPTGSTDLLLVPSDPSTAPANSQ